MIKSPILPVFKLHVQVLLSLLLSTQIGLAEGSLTGRCEFEFASSVQKIEAVVKQSDLFKISDLSAAEREQLIDKRFQAVLKESQSQTLPAMISLYIRYFGHQTREWLLYPKHYLPRIAFTEIGADPVKAFGFLQPLPPPVDKTQLINAIEAYRKDHKQAYKVAWQTGKLGAEYSLRAVDTIVSFFPDRILGLLRDSEQGRLRALVFSDSKYTFSVFSGLNYIFLNAPMTFVSQKIGLRKKWGPSVLLSLAALSVPVGVLIDMTFTKPVQEMNIEMVAKEIESVVKRNRAELIELVKSDIRYDEFQAKLKSTTPLSTDEYNLLLQVWDAQRLEGEFLKTFNPVKYPITIDSLSELVSDRPQFAHLESKLPSTEEELAKVNWRAILEINYGTHVLYSTTQGFLKQDSTFKEASASKAIGPLLAILNREPFAQEVLKRYQTRNVNYVQASRTLQQWLHYRVRSKELLLFGVDESTIPKMSVLEQELLKNMSSIL